MLEFMLCSLVTILPDLLIRRYVQGKRWGKHLNIFSVWYELRYGLTACAILTVSLITVIFYYHPTTTNVSSFFRTVTIVPEINGRVIEVGVKNNQLVKAGALLFKLDDTRQRTAAETARRQVAEVDASLQVAQSELAAAAGMVDQAKASFKLTEDEFNRKDTLAKRNSSAVSRQDVERLQNLLEVRKGAIESAIANQQATQAKIDTQLPAQKASAQAALEQAEAELAKTSVYAGVDGKIEQFTLREGDYINTLFRPAGILVPSDAGRARFQAGFHQMATQVIHPGTLAEMTCLSKPFTIVPMVVTEVQDVIPSGQIRPSDRLLDPQNQTRPGTLTVFMEPLYAGQTDDIPPGSNCIANAYTSNQDKLDAGGLSLGETLFLHMVDTVGITHAAILRLDALKLPVQLLVFGGH